MNTAPEQMVDEIAGLLEGDEGQENQEGQGMDDEEILNIIAAEMSQSSTGNYSTELDAQRKESLDYYLGNPRGDEQEGRSQAVSTDVADAIEWIMPQIIKALVAKGPVITFDAVGEDDENQAELETEFTHDTFMKENDGFLNLYEFVKDALMQKNGIFKIYYDETEEVKTESYDGLNQQEVEMLLQHPDVELVSSEQYTDEQAVQQMQQRIQMQMQQAEQSPDPQQGQAMAGQLMQQMQQLQTDPPQVFAVVVEVTHTKGKVTVDCIALEDFRINQHHDSLNPDTARFTAHVGLKTRSDLIEEGYDPDIVNNAETNINNQYERDYRFSAQDESVYSDPNYSEDESQALLEVSECYIKIDVEKTGVAKLMQITVLGSDDPTDILDMAPFEDNPFVSSSCIIMSHKFFGLSIYDRLKQLQDMKTSLWRNILDNLYLQNNREKEVVEDQVNLDDLLVSRPGGIKRVKQPGMIRELMVQPIGQEGYQMLEYLDQVRTGRVGVSPDTAGTIDALGTAVGSEGVAQLMTAKEELTGLMIRVIAETGVKQAYLKIRDLLVRYKDGVTPFKFKGQWKNVNPSQWGDRSRTTIKVGTGTGDDSRKVGAIQQAIAYQAQLVADPRNTLVDQTQLFEALDEFCRVSGLGQATPYFLDPASPEGKKKQEGMDKQTAEQKQKQEKMEQMMAKAQADLGEGERMKGEAAVQSQQAKLQVEGAKMELEHQKHISEADKAAFESRLAEMKTELDAVESRQKIDFDYEKLRTEEALKLTEMQHKYDLEAKKLKEQHNQSLNEQKVKDNATT